MMVIHLHNKCNSNIFGQPLIKIYFAFKKHHGYFYGKSIRFTITIPTFSHMDCKKNMNLFIFAVLMLYELENKSDHELLFL